MARRKFLPALRGVLGGGLEQKDLADRVRASSTSYVTPGQPYHEDWSTQRAVEEGWEGNPLVFRCIEVICQHGIGVPIALRRGDPEEGPLVQPGADPTRLLYVLTRRANPWETALTFRHRLIAQFLLSKRGVFIEVIRTRSGRVAMLNLLDPDLCDNIPTEKRDPRTNEVLESDPIGTVRVRTPGGHGDAYDYLPRFKPEASVEDQPASVLWIRSPHPTVMWKGSSPMQAGGIAIDLDKYARLYNRRFLQNDGRPGGLLSIRGSVSTPIMERLQAQFAGGVDSAGRTTVISADDVSYADTSGSPRDMMWGDLSKATRDDIMLTFGVPESVMGNASGRTFDNADAEYELFWQGRMLSLLRTLDDQLDVLTGGVDDDLFLRHDLSKVWVLGRHQRTTEDRAADDIERGAITIDDYREIKGLERLNIPATRVLWLPAGRVPAGMKDEDTDEVAALRQVGLGEEPEEGLPGGGPPEIPEGRPQLRLAAGAERRPEALEQRDVLGGDESRLEGKQGRARNPRATVWR